MASSKKVSGRSASKTGDPSAGGVQLHTPVKNVSTDANGYNPPTHDGVDLICPPNATLYAVCDAEVVDARSGGWWSKGATGDISKGDGVIRLKSLVEIGILKRGMIIGYGHAEHPVVHVGQKVKAGDVLGKAGFANAWHVHFFMGPPGSDARDGEINPEPFWHMFRSGEAVDGAGGSSSSSGNGSGGGGGGSSPAAAFATYLELPGILDTARSQLLSGEKSLMNDEPLLPFIQQLCQASLRSFQSMPNGNFYAFFPDYFGGLSHRTAYWEIDDVEIIDGHIDLSDDPLATHVFIVGDTSPSFGTIDLTDELMTSGVVTIFDAFSSNFISGVKPIEKDTAQSGKAAGPGLGGVINAVETVDTTLTGTVESISEKSNALAFLTKYGARPYREEAPMVRSPFYELFLAYQKFMLLWSQQFLTTFEFTFMPELFPGGIVAFPDHGIQCYVAEVSHEFDYESGFTTKANLMAPAALPSSDRKNVHNGLIRAFTLGSDLPYDPFAEARANRDKNRKHHGSQ